jgi:peptidoglycan/LPS O-acetylase OafA/YrhL
MHMPLLFLYTALRKVFVPDDQRLVFLNYNFSLTEAWLGFALFLSVTLLLASFTYHYIEKPARQFLNRSKRSAVEQQVVAANAAETSLQG